MQRCSVQADRPACASRSPSRCSEPYPYPYPHPSPYPYQIIYGLQDVFNLLPNSNVEELVKAFAVKTNDMMLAVYLSSIIRSVLALHNLINNKLYNKEKQLKQEKGDADDKEKAKEKPDGKENEKADGKAADGKDKPADKK